MRDTLRILEDLGARRLHVYTEPEAGLRAFLVVDDLTLGPAAGGIRTASYASPADAVRDAARLARAMTLKCALAGLDAGGGKMVVMDRPELDRPRAFATLGQRIDELGGLFLTAGDLGTTVDDLRCLARHTSHVSLDEGNLSAATARGLLRCLEACARLRDRPLTGLRLAVQGCGAIGSAVARALAEQGAELLVTDLRDEAARAVAEATGAEVIEPGSWLGADVDMLVPCAGGDVIDAAAVPRIRAWAVCGAANNVLAQPGVDAALIARQVLFVPDVVASAGAVIDGICRLRGTDPEPLIDRLGVTAEEVLRSARARGKSPSAVAMERGHARLRRASR